MLSVRASRAACPAGRREPSKWHVASLAVTGVGADGNNYAQARSAS